MISLGSDAGRSIVTVAACGAIAVMAGCASAVTAPSADTDVVEAAGQNGSGQKEPSAPGVPDFFFVSNASGTDQIWIHESGATRRLTWTDVSDSDPHGAAGRLVFTSTRDGNAEVYIAAWDGSGAARLTSDGSHDGSPALSPLGDRVAWVTHRSGVHRIWVMNADGSDQVPLETGAPSYNPERAPSWSPDGGRIAFSSTRTGTSQIFVMPSGGGLPVQVTREPGGAFEPAWSPDGKYIYYVEASSTARIRRVNLGNGQVEAVVGDAEGAGQPACNATMCLFTGGAYGGRGDILSVTFARKGNVVAEVVATGAREGGGALVVR